jgi:alkylation response protein AidB-like acyl-CoA dehydrogenase
VMAPSSGRCRTKGWASEMDFAETSEQTMLREAVRRIATEFGDEYFYERARRGERTDELWEAVARAGFVGVNLPPAYGGGGLGIGELALIAEELASQGCPLLLLMVSPAVCGTLLARFGTEAQCARWLPGLASGSTKMAFAITEPDAGSNFHRLSTVARPVGSSYRLDGNKHYISGVDHAEALMVVVKTGTDAATGRARLSIFIVDTDTPGLECTLIPLDVASPEKQFVVYFDDVVVDADRLLGAEGDGLKQVFQGLNPERVMTAATANGIARHALRRAASYANQRRVWDVPIGAHQGLSHPLAAAQVAVELARVMTQKAAFCHDQGLSNAGETANMAKYAAVEAALSATDAAIQTYGGNAFAAEYNVVNLWSTVRVFRTIPVSREMILNFIAEHSLGLPRSY